MERSEVSHIPSLDGIRGLSFLLVFFAHAGLERYIPGGLGVTIFFFLSGFLITTLMRQEYEKSGTLNLKHFFARRGLRILPPLYLVLFVTSLISIATISWQALTMQALQMTNYWTIYRGFSGMPDGTGVYWSLSVEEHFYLVFPWVFLAIQRFRPGRQALILYALCAIILLWRIILVTHFHANEDRTYMGTDTRIDSILFGCALAVWSSPVKDKLVLNERRWQFLYAPAAIALLLLCLIARSTVFRETIRYSVQGIALTVLFIAAIRYPLWAPMRLLNTKTFVFMGALSYSLYLLHFAVIIGIQKNYPGANPVEQGVVALCMSVALSWLIYVVIEKPCAKLRRRLTASRPARGALVGAGQTGVS